jgi:hypothetical protein
MSRFMKMFTATATVALVLIASIQAPTLAFTYDEGESNDASDVWDPLTSPNVTNTIDDQTVINGSVIYSGASTTPDNVADIYKISLSAGTFQVALSNNGFTPILALFNSSGQGVYIDDDSQINVNIDQAGVYYLGISVNTVQDRDVNGNKINFDLITVPSTEEGSTVPESGGQAIFPNSSFDIDNNVTPQPLQTPTSLVQGGYRFDGMTFPSRGSSYTATLTGTAVNVPEPAMAGTGFSFLALALTTQIGRRLRLTGKGEFRS